MPTPEQTRALVESLHDAKNEREKLFLLIAGLANLLDRSVIIETLERLLAATAEDNGDTVFFGDVGVAFGDDGRVKSVFQTFDGEERQCVP